MSISGSIFLSAEVLCRRESFSRSAKDLSRRARKPFAQRRVFSSMRSMQLARAVPRGELARESIAHGNRAYL
jgi:hypothetical protein